MPFMNAHYVYALMRAGRDQAVDTALASIRERSIADDDEGKQVWAPVGCAVVEAAACFGPGNRARAAQLLDPVMPLMSTHPVKATGEADVRTLMGSRRTHVQVQLVYDQGIRQLQRLAAAGANSKAGDR
jgi:hypothetical protein